MILAERYRLDEEIGQGGFSQVFRATELRLGRPVAIKIMSQDSVDAAGEQRFRREAELARQLVHPNTVRLLDFELEARPSPFIVYELLSGETLDNLIKREGAMSERRAAKLAAQVLKSLMEAHAAGIVHRDMKPANVFVCSYAGETDFVKVLDFGIAKSPSSTQLTAAGMAVGTPRYMPPDQIYGKPPHPSMDVYAVGMMLAEMLAGQPVVRGTPLEAAMAQLSPDPVALPEAVRRSRLAAVIARAVDKDPTRRTQSAGELLGELDRLAPTLSSEPVAPAPFATPDPELPSGQVVTEVMAPPSADAPTLLRPRPLPYAGPTPPAGSEARAASPTSEAKARAEAREAGRRAERSGANARARRDGAPDEGEAREAGRRAERIRGRGGTERPTREAVLLAALVASALALLLLFSAALVWWRWR
jgi:serine/threonine-protein kinase